MPEADVIKILQEELGFNNNSIIKLKSFSQTLLIANKKHNFISKNTEKDIWQRHILDSAQLVKFIDFKNGSLADLGSGAGFPGMVLAIFNSNINFKVKLYEKSPVKRIFLEELIAKYDINAEIFPNVYDSALESEYIVSRAFKKIEKIIQVSREIVKNPHKLIILKGKNAQDEINKAFKSKKYDYKLEKSITDKDSKIVIINFN
jgi:16S rRNA (guanine527-N7)-methyltransferase